MDTNVHVYMFESHSASEVFYGHHQIVQERVHLRVKAGNTTLTVTHTDQSDKYPSTFMLHEQKNSLLPPQVQPVTALILILY